MGKEQVYVGGCAPERVPSFRETAEQDWLVGTLGVLRYEKEVPR